MFKKFKNFFFLSIFFVFFIFVLKYYISEPNVILINKSRTSYSAKLNEKNIDLPILENDTKNIIIYIDDLENFKKKRKKRFWEKLISNSNE